MTGAARQGLQGLVECLAEQQQLRATGVIEAGGGGNLYIVFGHPLHALAGATTGLDAVDAIGHFALTDPQCQVRWMSGVTAGRSHSLAPADGVLERLRVLGGGSARAAGPDPIWGIVISSICSSLESELRRHAGPLVEVVAGAQAEPTSILEAIEQARSISLRAVAPARVAGLLDEAEALVKQTNTA
jgi:hypothetical protein